MDLSFRVEPLKFQIIEELPRAWSPSDYTGLLKMMDYEDVSGLSPEEIKEMCPISLAETEPEEAAKVVLGYTFGNRLNEGQIDNLSNEMQEEKMWEEYADLSLHEGFFNATQILYQSYNGKFPHPEAVCFQVRVTAQDAAGLDIFNRNSEAALIRLLLCGMPENTVISRLFGDQLRGGDFKEAGDILWQIDRGEPEGHSVIFDVISSLYWFRDFKYAGVFEGTAHGDE